MGTRGRNVFDLYRVLDLVNCRVFNVLEDAFKTGIFGCDNKCRNLSHHNQDIEQISMTDLVKLYNPANASSLTPEEVHGLQQLTLDQIKELALAYPNSIMQQAYLLIIDSTKAVDKQIANLSTFENLYNLIARNGLKQWVAFNFKTNFRPRNISPINHGKKEVRDLSDVELMSLPGFRTKNETFPPETVEVVKVKSQTSVASQNPINTISVNTISTKL